MRKLRKYLLTTSVRSRAVSVSSTNERVDMLLTESAKSEAGGSCSKRGEAVCTDFTAVASFITSMVGSGNGNKLRHPSVCCCGEAVNSVDGYDAEVVKSERRGR